MMQAVIDLQNNAVSSIVSQLKDKNELTFKSPTGSGKTYMMADLMDRILSKHEDIIFLVSSLSKGGLAEQNYNNFAKYSDNKTFKNINPYLITSETGDESRLFIPTNYNVYVLPRDLYKENSKLKQGALANFLDTITKPRPLGLEKKVYLIKDECHIATSNLDSLKDKYFEKILNCSATPKLDKGEKADVQIFESDAVAAKLIKKVEYDTDSTLENAIDKFKEIKEQYINATTNDKNFGSLVNPCLIIQISNKEKANEEIEEVQNILLKTKYQDLQWMLIVDKDKDCKTNNIIGKLPVSKWKDEAKKPESTIDIIIFKMVITEGWDIPRACMLYQVRNSQSKQLDEQVIGRVRRNPKLLTYDKLSQESKDLISTAFVYGIVNKEEQGVQEVKLVGKNKNNEIQNELKIKTTKLKRPIEKTSFNIKTFLKEKIEPTMPLSIFDLYEQYSKAQNEVKELGSSYITDIRTWFQFVNNLGDISKESKAIICDYETNMEITKDANGNELEFSLPLISYYTDNGNYKAIGNWLWQRVDENEKFSFDSEAEKEWCEILTSLISEDAPNGIGRIVKSIPIKTIIEEEEQEVKKYLLGKNYLPNSDIKYEYYLYGIHSSYPDFIMKDYANRIHLFESKSLNKSNNLEINGEEYKEKVNALKECYKYASKLTGYYFYLPIKVGSSWNILQYYNGNEEILDKNSFIKFMKK